LPGRQRKFIDFEVDKAIIQEDTISQIILHPEVKDRKIVSLSIVGAFRKGKSFLLDYMLRYLYATVSFNF
jgi:atlastin